MFCLYASRADTETINWYVDGTDYTTTTCQSGGDVTLPAAPTKTGYTFVGWQTALYDFSTLDYTVNGNSSSGSGKRWRIKFPYGAVYGEALCSPTSNDEWYTNTQLDTTTGEGKYCWCRMTEFIPSGSDIIYGPLSSPPWIFNSSYNVSLPANCAGYCAMTCANWFINNASNRRALFGV